MQNKVSLSARRLKTGAKHIKYEVACLREAATLLVDIFLQKITFTNQVTDRVVTRSVFEAFLLHCRALLEFFYDIRGSKGKDFHYSQYLVARHSLDLYYSKRVHESVAKTMLNRLDKQLVHISLKRSYYNRKNGSWTLILINEKFNKTIWAFWEALPAQRKKWFSKILPEIP